MYCPKDIFNKKFKMKENYKISYILENLKYLKYVNFSNSSKIYKNLYIYLLYCFKFLLFKNFFNINFFSISYFYQKYLYFNIKDSRFYYLLYYLLLKYSLFNFIDFFFKFILKLETNDYNFSSIKKKINWMEKDDFINIFFFKKYFIFFFNNKIFIYIYLLLNINLILYFNKFNYYIYLNKFKYIFFFNEFHLKIEYKNFFLYNQYIEYFRLVKYNEYIANTNIFWDYPFIKILYRIYINQLKFRIIVKKNILSKVYNIYAISKNDNNNFYYKYITDSLINIKNVNDTNMTLFKLSKKISQTNEKDFLNLIKGFSFLYYKNIKINNNYVNYKILNFDIFYFIKFLNPIFFFKLFKIFKLYFFIYISFISYEMYHIYICDILLWSKIRWVHLLNLFWNLYSYKLKYFSFFLKIFIKFKFKNIFNNIFLINYGFLSFYFLENNKYINLYFKKNILLYRIYNTIIGSFYNYKILNYFDNYINSHSHRYYSLKNPNFRKKWHFSFIKNFRKKKLFSPLLKIKW